jgi:hypothetical protein
VCPTSLNLLIGINFQTLCGYNLKFSKEPQIIPKIPFSFKGSAKVLEGWVSAIGALKDFNKKMPFLAEMG